jgi:hypothetical protein
MVDSAGFGSDGDGISTAIVDTSRVQQGKIPATCLA